MKTPLHLTETDWQALSEYLDGQLSAREQAALEKRLSEQAELRAGLEELRQTRTLLRSVRLQPTPRNFTLTAAMVQQQRKPHPLLRFVPVLNFASAASALAVVALLVAGLLPGAAPAAQPAPQAVMNTEAVMALEAPAAQAAEPGMIIQWNDPNAPMSAASDLAMGKGGGGGGGGGMPESGFILPPQTVEGLENAPESVTLMAEPTNAAAAADPAPDASLPQSSAPVEPQPNSREMTAPAEELTGSGPILGVVPPAEAQATNQSNLKAAPQEAAQPRAETVRWWLLPAVLLGLVAMGSALAAQWARRATRA